MTHIGFIPHAQCTVLSGECFRKSRCLDKCTERFDENKRSDRERIASLEKETKELRFLVNELIKERRASRDA